VSAEAVDMNIINGIVVTPRGRERLGIAIKDGRIVGLIGRRPAPDGRPGHRRTRTARSPGHHRSGSASGPFPSAVGGGGVRVAGRCRRRHHHVGHPEPEPPLRVPAVEAGGQPEDVVSFFKVFDAGREIWDRDSSVDFFFTFQLETDEQAEEIPRYVN